MPKLVTQTGASERFHLYGDPTQAEYADTDGDGIDDRRSRVLAALADRFSPVLRRNNFSFPRNFKDVAGDHDVLFVDTWRAGKRVHSAEVPLGWCRHCKNSDGAGANAALAGLVADFQPLAYDPRYIRPEEYEEKVLFIDLPGHDPVSWRTAYAGADPRTATLYTHFFVHEDTATGGDHRYYLVAQHWLFYPFNDATNNHEGDWEHINVLITTKAAVAADKAGHMSAAQLTELLESAEGARDPSVIAFVDYYFHEVVMTLDYVGAYHPAGASLHKRTALSGLTIWRDTTFIRRTVLERVTAGGGVFATHPIGYIGGNNKGPDELLSLWPRFQASYNRNGHGTYPFPGTWQGVGPLGSTEQLAGHPMPRLKNRAAGSLHDIVDDPAFIVFGVSNIILVPDWERVLPLLSSSDQARREWGWLILPMRWGFPAAASPGGGAIAHTDVGNISPEGPAFQPTWNRVGTAAGWRRYEPSVFRVLLVPTTPWDRMKNGWGVLNVPLALLGVLPGWNVLVTQVAPWLSGALHSLGAPPPRTFNPGDLAMRFTSINAGYQNQFGGHEFAQLLQNDSGGALGAGVAARQLNIDRSTMRQASAVTARYGMEVHYGRKLSVENTYARTERGLASTLRDGSGRPVARLLGTIRTTDLTGGVRYAISAPIAGVVQPFVRGGYGWTSYRLDRVTVDGIESDYAARGGYSVTLLPSRRWWPNTWYAGIGVELFVPRQGWLFPQLGYGLRAEITGSRHRLGATQPGQPNLGMVSRSDFAISGVVGW